MATALVKKGRKKELSGEQLRKISLRLNRRLAFRGFISWLFLPVVAAGMYFDVPVEYLYIGAALFTVVFCIVEMDKPDKPPQL